MPFDPDAPLPGAPDPWTGSSTPAPRDGPPYAMTEMIAAEPALAERLAARLAAAPQIEVIEAGSLRAGLEALAARRDKFDTVILSPGAPSYGQLEKSGVVFKDFEERGRAFVRIANELFPE